MNCESATERLLSLPTGNRPDADLSAHMAECASCRTLVARMRSLDAKVARLPVVDSTPRKAAFLASLNLGTTVRPASLGSNWLRNPNVRTFAALAAAIALVVTAISLWPRNPKQAVEYAAVKHDLLERSIAFACEQGKQSSAAQRVNAASDHAGHVLASVRGIYLATSPDDVETIRELSDLFENTLKQGVTESVAQLDNMNPVDRKAALARPASAMAGYVQTARELSLSAPQHVKPVLARIETAALACANSLKQAGANPATIDPLPPLSGEAGRELRFTKLNNSVIAVLTNRGLKAGAAADAVDRANEVREAAAAVEAGLARAVSEGDADRAGEFGEHLAMMLVTGVQPALERASEGGENPASPSYERVRELKAQIKKDAERARAALPGAGRLADHPRVKAARKAIDDATAKLL